MIKNNPYIFLLRLYWRYLPNKKKTILFLLMQVVRRAVSLLWPFVLGKALIIVQQWGEWMLHRLLPYAIITLVIPFVEWLFHGPSRVMEENIAFDTAKTYKEDLYHKAISLPMVRHTDNHSGETIDRINKASDALRRFGSSISQYVGTFISFWGALVALILIWPVISWVMLFLFVAMVFLIQWFDKKIVAWIKDENTLSHKVNWLLFDYLSNIRTLITLRFLSPTENSLSQAIVDQKEPFEKHVVRNEWKWFVTDAGLQVVTAGIIIAYIVTQWNAHGTVLIGILTMIAGYVERLANTFYNITWSYSEILRFGANVAAVEAINTDYDDHIQKTKSYQPLSAKQFVHISNLYFAYSEHHRKVQKEAEQKIATAIGDKQTVEHDTENHDAAMIQKPSTALQGISLQRNVWDKIAVIGESGSGKSTLLSLMRWLYDVDSVQVTIDGEEYTTLQVLTDKTSLVPQEPEIFEESMLFNISMWTDVSQDTVEKYAKIALFHDIAVSLPYGYQTSIKEKWVNLSWGQKQRLALARGLLAAEKSDILLLDESTSSVDSINEKRIYTNIFHEFSQKTILAAIHKLHLLPMFDHIYVFDKWHIVEHGSFEALLANHWMFTKMRKEYTVSMDTEMTA